MQYLVSLSHFSTLLLSYIIPLFLPWIFSMGSVLAASSPSPAPPASSGATGPGLMVPPGFGMPPVSPVIPPTEAASAQQQETENTLPNPGAFDECHRKCKGKGELIRQVHMSLR